jgi:eukaryotic-like serine/threonine-protein kinase
MSTTENPSSAPHPHRTADTPLTPERWQRIKEVFADVQERDPSERAAFLANACAADESLHSEVESLLAAAESEAAASVGISSLEDLMIGRRVGAYKIIRRIGRGGMATVYLASRADEQYEKQVAIKILLPELGTEELLRRFRNERQTLAKLDHPNIVKLLDGGSTEEGLPYLVMDYVQGVPIDQYCDNHKLSTEERLRLFCQICAAVRCAHENLVIHRDLKPSNILITEDGLPKLLDFGISKVLQSRNGSSVTQTLTRRMTPAYASPEQVKGESVTPATDIYSLGVVLYELLTGHRPYKLKQQTPAEVERAICEQEPEKPSTAINRVETENLPDGTTVSKTPEVVSALRESQPEKLRRRLTGDLDNIILMALQKEPRRRYLSVEEFSRDIQRHLEHRPITARPSTLGYRGLKFVRRHKTEAIAAALVLAVMFTAVGYAIWEQHRALESARAELLSQRSRGRRSVAVLGFKNLSGRAETGWLSVALSEMLTTELSAGGKLRTIPGESVAQTRINLSLADADSLSRETLSHVYRNLGSDFVVLGSYLDMADTGRNVRLDLRVQDAAQGETVASFSEVGNESNLPDLVIRTGTDLRRRLGIAGVSPADAAKLQEAFAANPEAVRMYAEGLASLRTFDALRARDLLEKAVAIDPNYAMAHSALADAWSSLGYDAKSKDEAKKALALAEGLPREQNLLIEGRYRQAAREWDKAIEIYRTLFNFFPDNLDYGLRLAAVQTSAGKGNDSLATIEALRKLPPPGSNDPRVDLAEAQAANSISDYKRQAAAGGQGARKAESIGARLLLATAKMIEARAIMELGEPAKVTSTFSEAMAIFAAAGDRFGVARALQQQGLAYFYRGDLDHAKKAYQQAMAIQQELGNRSNQARLWNGLGLVLSRQNDFVGAKQAFLQTLTICRELDDRPMIGTALGNLFMSEFDQGNYAAAKKYAQESLDVARQVGEQSGIALQLNNLALVLVAQGDGRGARPLFEQSVQISRKTGKKNDLGIALINLSDLYFYQGEVAAAESTAREAMQIFSQAGNELDASVALSRLGDIKVLQGDLPGARKDYEEVKATDEKLGDARYLQGIYMALANLAIEEKSFSDAEVHARHAVQGFKQAQQVANQAGAEVLLVGALLGQNKLDAAKQTAEEARQLASKDGDQQTQISASVAQAQVQAAWGKYADATSSLKKQVAEAQKAGFVGLQFDARLALGETEIKGGDTSAAKVELASLEQDAKAKGFVLVARKAAAAMKRH